MMHNQCCPFYAKGRILTFQNFNTALLKTLASLHIQSSERKYKTDPNLKLKLENATAREGLKSYLLHHLCDIKCHNDLHHQLVR